MMTYFKSILVLTSNSVYQWAFLGVEVSKNWPGRSHFKVVCTSKKRENCVCSSKIFFFTFEIFHDLSSYIERFLLK